jgi:EmrB/QacA subfamily drug resistance transporter
MQQTLAPPAAAAPPRLLATRQGKLTLALLCAVAFLDFIDATIVNVALPSIRRDLGVSLSTLVWIPSGYLLTYGGFMLLGGRAADLLGRRRILVAGTIVFGLASLTGGVAGSAGLLIAARLVQGVGAAMMLPAALSLLTTTFSEGPDRNVALGAWGAVAGFASAVGALAGGALAEGPGWRWVLWVNLPVCVLVLGATFRLIAGDRRRARRSEFDARGAVLATAGMLLLTYALVKAPDVGWGAARTLAELGGALALLAAFVVNERLARHPLLPLSIFRLPGLAAADVTQLVGVAGFIAMFFFVTLYMQTILDWSPLRTGVAYLPVCGGVILTSGLTSQLIPRLGTRPVIVAGALVAAAGVFLLSGVPVHGSYAADLLPGLVVMSLGLGAVFVGVTTAANAGVPPRWAGLAAALLNASQQVGGALGLAVLSALATSHTTHLLAVHTAPAEALTGGFRRALLVAGFVLVAAALVGLRATNSRGEATA